jgi:hypothetical protein
VNVAFSALLVYLLLLPGFLFRTYFKRAEKVVLDVKPFGQAAVDAFLTAIVIDPVWYWLAYLVTGTRVDFHALFSLIAGEKSAELDSDRRARRRSVAAADRRRLLRATVFRGPDAQRARPGSLGLADVAVRRRKKNSLDSIRKPLVELRVAR